MESITNLKFASLPKRTSATLIDMGIFVIIFSLLYILIFFQKEILKGQDGTGFFYGVTISRFLGLYIILSWLILISLLEFSKGQTIGKKLVKIKVVRQDQSKMTLLISLARHLFDIFELVLLIGPIMILSNKNRQRLGDILAKTYVITVE
jgi:uncharacterized RDD family membrane protein YckC